MNGFTDAKGYPKTVELKSYPFGYGGNRIFKITKDEALSISREFKLPTDFKSKWKESEVDFYYFNHAHGKLHAIFWLPRPVVEQTK